MVRVVLIMLLTILMSISSAQQIAYKIEEKDLIPEGIAYDPVNEKFYVSRTYKRKIVEIDKATGSYHDFIREKQHGIAGVIGLQVDAKRRVLWAVTATAGDGMPVKDIGNDFHLTGVYKYDLRNGVLLKKYLLENPDGHFLNDLTVLKDGTVFITDTSGKQLYKISVGDKLELFHTFKEPLYPNGIVHSPDEKLLIVAVYKGAPDSFAILDLETKEYQIVPLPEGENVAADGICLYGKNIVAIQPSNKQRVVARYVFENADYRGTPRIETLVSNNPVLLQPTTGVIVGDALYFIGTSQLQHFRKLHKDHGKDYPMDKLTDALILRVDLK